MEYTIDAKKREDENVVDVAVKIFNDDGDLIEAGKTSVATDDESIAIDYAENIFLPDIRNNASEYSQMKYLELPIDARLAAEREVAELAALQAEEDAANEQSTSGEA